MTGETPCPPDGRHGSGSGDGAGRGPDAHGYELPLLLFAGFRTLIDQLHAELAEQGHPGMRPAHGFAMQAIGPGGATASELARRLGVSKQAAGKTAERLMAVGYAERVADPADARRKIIRLTPHGVDALRRSAALFEELRARWAATLGDERLRQLETDLRTMTAGAGAGLRVDVAGWFGP
ncbi:winged helix-turn-helix transcriptional regulator [Streptomyces pactum]|uniref:Winged helix-turn-helix transcriptional regulator n=1 Tax=Streptomyces pactum TaxID=68249 RepID=A0ABS0NSG4_9ACTN|nr:MarR family winged helix-turn-helix transcriptional regulator [Streptomyces pactum]MBH5338152.1 winged helix-turn-helix transcriptional regulator [Streptomyces pactum]